MCIYLPVTTQFYIELHVFFYRPVPVTKRLGTTSWKISYNEYYQVEESLDLLPYDKHVGRMFTSLRLCTNLDKF